MNLEEINNKIEKGYTNNTFLKIIIGITVIALMSAGLGYIYANGLDIGSGEDEEDGETEILPPIITTNEFDYENKVGGYIRTIDGRIIDRNTKLEFKKLRYYFYFLETGDLILEHININDDYRDFINYIADNDNYEYNDSINQIVIKQ